MRAKACIKCKEYVVLYPNDQLSNRIEKLIEKYHHHHNLIIINLDEIQDTFKPFF